MRKKVQRLLPLYLQLFTLTYDFILSLFSDVSLPQTERSVPQQQQPIIAILTPRVLFLSWVSFPASILPGRCILIIQIDLILRCLLIRILYCTILVCILSAVGICSTRSCRTVCICSGSVCSGSSIRTRTVCSIGSGSVSTGGTCGFLPEWSRCLWWYCPELRLWHGWLSPQHDWWLPVHIWM